MSSWVTCPSILSKVKPPMVKSLSIIEILRIFCSVSADKDCKTRLIYNRSSLFWNCSVITVKIKLPSQKNEPKLTSCCLTWSFLSFSLSCFQQSCMLSVSLVLSDSCWAVLLRRWISPMECYHCHCLIPAHKNLRWNCPKLSNIHLEIVPSYKLSSTSLNQN